MRHLGPRLVPRRHHLLPAAMLAVGYFLLTRIGLSMPFMSGQASPVWPSAGLALGMLWVYGDALWIGVLLGAGAAAVLSAHAPVFVIGSAAGATLEALLGVWMLRAARFDGALGRFRDVVALGIAAAIASFVSALIGTLSLHAAGAVPDALIAPALRVWWIGDLMGTLLIAPVVLTFARYEPRRDSTPRAIEIVGVIAFFAVTLSLTMFQDLHSGEARYPLAFLTFPGILWVALRFGPRGSALANVLIAAASITGTIAGYGPFVVGDRVTSLLLLQSYMAVIALTSLTLAAVIAERESATAALLEREHELTEAAADLNAIVQSFSDRYFWVGRDDKYIKRRLHPTRFGRAAARVEGMPVAETLPPEIAERARAAWEQCRRTREVVVIEYSLEEHGETHHYEARHAPLPDGAVLAIVREVTNERRMQDQLQQAQKMEAVGRLAGGVAHDFNNLLTVIRGYADLVASSLAESGAARGWSDELVKAIDRASALTRRLLTLSRRQVVSARPLDLSALLLDIGNMLTRLAGEDVRVHIEAGSEPCWVRADQAQLEQVIVNLVVNARDAMPNGGSLRLLVDIEEVDPEHWNAPPRVPKGRWVRLRVVDDGTGMDEATLSRAFEPFFSTKPPERGSGLGLSIVYGIVRQSGGEVLVTSAPGRGTTVAIYLPESVAGTAVPRRVSSARTAGRGGFAQGTVLVAEDEDMVRSLVCEALRRDGYHVLEAANGTDALLCAAAHDGRIDLLLTDIVMPGMNGRELAERMQQARPETAILYMSGYTDHAVFGAQTLGPETAYLPKPFTTDELLRGVAETLAAASASARD